ncbi:methyltransferase family protein [Nocardia nova]|uniref:methyltransferase family protein n=1 Tax=Nocardia nova TaxID=37330 RepID=UPI0025B111A6|nr:isoprenylcysteine carboxylmethyltransferase family protein [Nocardia nova]
MRNPMYLGVVTIIAGQSLLLGQLAPLGYAALIWILTATFVLTYEQPTLTARYSAQYERYRTAVPAWLPRLHTWRALDGCAIGRRRRSRPSPGRPDGQRCASATGDRAVRRPPPQVGKCFDAAWATGLCDSSAAHAGGHVHIESGLWIFWIGSAWMCLSCRPVWGEELHAGASLPRLRRLEGSGPSA